ncbi:MAG: hypothetical protein JW922_08990 [Paludibacteraceae bacterium]|nr:hypothetical protein [Paludibacteraceae bacterium]
MNTQKAVTTQAQNIHEQIIMIRRYTDPENKARKLYDALKYKYVPFSRKKFVVHKSELENTQITDYQFFNFDIYNVG